MAEKNKPWGFELEEYIREGEPDQAEKAQAWQIAIGLQDVDGLKPSRYLLENAKLNIEGEISIDEVERRVDAYYAKREERTEQELKNEEADKVSSRITRLLKDKSFSFSPATLKKIHEQLFTGLIEHAGDYRDYNITKREWVLKGDTVRYASWDTISETIEYDFDIEENFSYKNLSAADIARHVARFASGIWQIHPFSEGNTRTTAVFVIKYLNSLGYEVTNDPFHEHSWYFRNALVRANYTDLTEGVTAENRYLELFFENLLLGTNHELKNRFMHLDWVDEHKETAVDEAGDPKCKNCTLDCTLEELAILKQLIAKPKMTQKELAMTIGCSERTIKSRTVSLQKRGLLARENGKRSGSWIVLADLGNE